MTYPLTKFYVHGGVDSLFKNQMKKKTKHVTRTSSMRKTSKYFSDIRREYLFLIVGFLH